MPDPGRTGRGPAEARFDALYRGHHREILAYCIRRLPPAEAEDAAADVFAIAWRRIDDVPPADEAIAWLFGVAHRVLSNHRRAGRRFRRLSGRLGGLGSSPSETPETQVVRSAEQQLLITALESLRWSDQEILRLATWEQLPHASIAEMLGISPSAVGQRLSRARKRLGEELVRDAGGSRISLPKRKAG